jgi:XTP/dITP diphosphohydrolase
MRLRPGVELVVATSNPGKLREIRELFGGMDVVLRSLEDLPPVQLPEEGDDYEENARAKARTVAASLGVAALADDSGLEVEALGGAPGPGSARYGGPGLDDAGRVVRLLAELSRIAPGRRRARFVCVAAWAEPAGRNLTAVGRCDGRILETPQGAGGFGYDPIFQPDGESVSMAELSQERKNALSHRARAFRALVARLDGGS